MKKRRYLAFILVIVMSLSLLAACAPRNGGGDVAPPPPPPGPGAAQDGGQATQDTPEPGETGRDRLIIGMTGDVGTFNPHTSTMMLEFRIHQNIFDGIVRSNSLTGEIEPMLAERWTVSDDGMLYRFYLRNDVYFHNGDKFNAYNVLGNFEIWQDAIAATRIVSLVEEFIVIDEYTFEMVLTEPSTLFLVILAGMAIVHDGVYNEDVALFGERPVGTGAYMLASRTIGAGMEFTRFDRHFRGPAPIETVEIRILPDANTLAVALEMGEIDLIEGVPPASVQILQATDHLTVNILEGVQVTYIDMNTERAPFNDIRVRQAIAHAIDRQLIIDMAREGLGTPTNIVHLNAMPFRPVGYPVFEHNPQRARELLAEAGFPNGLVLDEPIITGGWVLTVTEVVQNLLMLSGIDAEVAPMEWGPLSQATQDGDFLMTISGWNSISLHPDFFMHLYRSENIGSTNSPRFSNPRVDELADLAIITADPAAVQEIYNELYYIISTELPRIPIYVNAFIVAHDENLQISGLNSIANNYFNMSWR